MQSKHTLAEGNMNKKHWLAGLAILALIVMGACAAPAAPTLTIGENYKPVIDPANFVAEINHPYFPLKPGTVYEYLGDNDGQQEKVVVEVLYDTKTIMGVICVVVTDTVWIDEVLVESTFDWYAQDKDGNVWYMGEDTKELENGEVVSTAGSWEGGIHGAQPGIIMLANPQVGDAYRQEYFAGEAEDMAQILSLSEALTIGFGSYDKVLVTKEWTPLEPGVAEQKYYAEGIGLVMVEVTEGGAGRVELVKVTIPE